MEDQIKLISIKIQMMIYRTMEQKLIMTFSRNFLKFIVDFQQNISDYRINAQGSWAV